MRFDLLGKTFGRLTVLRHDKGKGWLCHCECGNEIYTRPGCLESGNTRSCGCLQREVMTRHGFARKSGKSPTYNSWAAMISRVTNPNHPRWADWGGRGITVCNEWRDFVNFLLDMGEKPDGTTLDRINNNGNYEPRNCRWASPAQQARNNRNYRLTPDMREWITSLAADGHTMTQVGEIVGLNRHTVSKAWPDL